MFIPLHDDNPLRSIRFQYVTVLLIAVNALVFVLLQSGFVYELGRPAVAALAVVPGELLGSGNSGKVPIFQLAVDIPEFLTPVTYIFLHGNWMHLIGNMLFLWVFGDNIEDAMGHFRFFVFFLLSGAFAGLFHSMIMPHSTTPLIGASGGVAGVIGAYLMLHPNVMVWVLAFGRLPLHLRAIWVLGAWILFQFVMIAMSPGGGVAWWAHVGGIIAGIVLIFFMRRPGVPLFDRRDAAPV